MLQFMRQAAGSWVVKILFVVLILSFCAWGIRDVYNMRSQDTTVAEVGPVKIDAAALQRQFNQQIDRMRQVYGPGFDAAQARQFGVLDQTVHQMIDNTLTLLAARDLGLSVGDQAVLREIAALPQFRAENGQFDKARFDAALANAGLSEQSYVVERRQDIARAQLLSALVTGVAASDTVGRALYQHRNEKRIADMVTVPASSFTDIPAPDDAALAAAEKQKADRFSTPEYRALTVVPITIAALAKDASVTDADLHAAYDSRRDEFKSPPTRDLQEVTVQDEAKAKAIAAAVQGGKSLSDAAKENGAEVVSLPRTAAADLPAELAKPAFDQPVGKAGDPVKSPLGWHVLLVTAENPGGEKGFDAVKGDLAQDLKNGKAADQAATLANKMDDAMSGRASPEEAAKKLGLPVILVKAVDKAGKQPDGTLVDGVPNLPGVVDTAFGLEKGAASQLVQTSDGGFYLVRVDDITPPALKPLDQVRDHVREAWLADQKAKRAEDKAKAMVAAVKGGKSLEDVAKAEGLALAVSPAVTRDGQGAVGVPAQLISQMFERKAGDVAEAPSPDGAVVARLKEVQVPDPAADAAAAAGIRDQAGQQMTNDVLTEFGEALRKTYPVTIRQQVIDARFGGAS